MKKGFTLVELVIVIVIVGILSVVAVPIYKGYVRKAELTEAKVLASTIRTAQQVYFAEYGAWYTCGITQFDNVLYVDARANKYYRYFETGVVGDGSGWGATAVKGGGSVEKMSLWWDLDESKPTNAGSERMPVFVYTDADGKQSILKN